MNYGVQGLLMGLLAVAVIGSVLILILGDFFSIYNVSYNNPQIAQLNSSINNYSTNSNRTLNEVTQIIQGGNTTSSGFDNPFTTISTSVFLIIPKTLEMINYSIAFLISVIMLIPLTIPAIVINMIMFFVAITLVFLILNWLRGGLQNL